MARRHFIIILSAIGVVLLLLLVQGVFQFQGLVQADSEAVRDGTKVTVQYHITLRDNPATVYSDIEQFIQGEHVIPAALEQQMAGMQTGETKTFPLSAEEAFGPYDKTKTQTIPTADLPLDAQEGDIVDDDAGRTARIAKIFPDTTVLDLNHPLAGKPLMITLLIIAIENPQKLDKHAVPGKGDYPDLVIVDPGIGLSAG
jgi:FKBP-type peptidyl-prolyl cis-trans isomerase 2